MWYICLASYLPLIWNQIPFPCREKLIQFTISNKMDSRPGPGQSEYHIVLASVIDSGMAAGSQDRPIRVLHGFIIFFKCRSYSKRWSLLNEVVKLKTWKLGQSQPCCLFCDLPIELKKKLSGTEIQRHRFLMTIYELWNPTMSKSSFPWTSPLYEPINLLFNFSYFELKLCQM